MATSSMNRIVRHLRRAALLGDGAGLTDGQLLTCFIEHRDEVAFEALLQRHGPMVWGVCRRVLSSPHDAEDAFQATFLVLVRKATSVQPRERVGNWLYGVAHTTALRAKVAAARRRAREKQVPEMPEPEVRCQESWDDLQPLLDQELSRLPEKYRVPIVLCDLEGKSHQEAARQLGWPQGTLSGRLSRARALLAQRLRRQGLALTAGALAVLLTEKAASASVPASLMVSTAKSASLLATGQAMAAVVSAPVAALTEGVLQAMLLTKLKLGVAGLLVLVVVGLRAGTFSPGVPAVRASAPAATARIEAQNPEGEPTITGGVVGVSPDGKTVTVQVPPKERGGEAQRVAIRLSDQTDITYFGVRPNGAKPTQGYAAKVWLQAGSADAAAKVWFSFSETPRGGYRGQVVNVAADGKTFTLEMTLGRGPDAEKKRLECKLTDQTQVRYHYVPKDAAKPTAGYGAEVWLDDSSRENRAARVEFTDLARQRAAEVQGKLVGTSPDGTTLTVEIIPSTGRGEESKKIAVKLTIETEISYHGVGPDGAKPTEGLQAQVWLVDGSADAAAKVLLSKPQPQERGR